MQVTKPLRSLKGKFRKYSVCLVSRHPAEVQQWVLPEITPITTLFSQAMQTATSQSGKQDYFQIYHIPEDHTDYKVRSIYNGSEEWLIVSKRIYLNPCYFVDENRALPGKIPGIHFRPRMQDGKFSVWSSPSAIPSFLCHSPSGNGSFPGESNYFWGTCFFGRAMTEVSS